MYTRHYYTINWWYYYYYNYYYTTTNHNHTNNNTSSKYTLVLCMYIGSIIYMYYNGFTVSDDSAANDDGIEPYNMLLSKFSA